MTTTASISVVCPICNETLAFEFDGTLYGIIAIDDLAIMELTTTQQVSDHMSTHRTLNEAGTGFEQDPRYWKRLRAKLEMLVKSAPAHLKHLDDAGLGLP